jgi:hypothetical protein
VSDGNQMQDENGNWVPSEPLGYQGSGIDWEVSREFSVMGRSWGSWVGEGYDEDALCHVVRSRWRPVLFLKMRWAQR